MRKYLLDEEIYLSEENDLLNTRLYSNTLTKSITNVPDNKAFTIGLFGEWGSGKSSIINTSIKELETEQSKKYKFITYDAWKYANDSFRRMFLLKVQKELKFEKTDLMKSFYTNESEDIKIINKPSTSKTLSIIAIFLMGILCIGFYPERDTSNWALTLPIIISLLGLLVAIYHKTLNQYKVNVQKPRFFAPEQFEECFNQMMSYSLKKHNVLDNIKYYYDWVIKDKSNYEKGIDRLVIVIDNIDRCHKEQAYELLTNLKNFLSSQFNIIFLIPVDDKALKRHLFNTNKSGNVNEKEEFLRKFFNTTVRIKPHRNTELTSFVDKLNKKYEFNLKPDTINLLGSDYATNPRRIIQLINNLTSELNNYDKEFSGEYETFICICLILREEWEPYYNEICENVSCFFNYDDEKKDSSSSLFTFLRTIKPITNHVSREVISKIVTNSDAVFDEIPFDIKKAINTNDLESITNAIKEGDTLTDQVINYIINRLKNGVKENFTTQTENSFAQICSIFSQIEIDKSYNNSILSIIDGKLSGLIRKNEKYSDTIFYSIKLMEQGHYEMTEEIVELMEQDNSIKADQEKINKQLFLSFVLNYDLSILRKTELSKLKSVFNKLYNNGGITFKSSIIKNDKLKYLASDNLISKINSNATLDVNDIAFNDLLKLLSYGFEQDFNSIFDIDSLFKLKDEPVFFNVENSEVFKQVDASVILFELLPSSVLVNGYEYLSNWFQAITSNRKLLKEMYKNNNGLTNVLTYPDRHPNYFDTISVFDSKEVDCLVQLTKLSYHVLRLTGNKVETYYAFNTLFQNDESKQLIRKYFIDLKEEGFYLMGLEDIILSDTDYVDENIYLLKYLLVEKNSNNKYHVQDTSFKSKMAEIFEHVYDNDQLIQLLVDIKNDERVSNEIIDFITSQSHGEVLRLDKRLFSIAADTLDMMEYKSNSNFMKAVASNGSKRKIKEIVKVIIHLVNSESTIEEALEIANELKRVNSVDSKKLIAIIEGYETESEELNQKLISTLNHIKLITE